MDVPGSDWHRRSSSQPTGSSSNNPVNGYACNSITNVASSSCTAASRSVALLRAKLREKLAQLFYYHGLNCSRHPLLLVITSLLLFCVCIYPIVGVHLFQNDYSQQYMTDLSDFVALRNLNQQLHMQFHATNSDQVEHQQDQQSHPPTRPTAHFPASFSSSFFGNSSSLQDFLLRNGFDLRKELKNPPRWVRRARLDYVDQNF